MELRSRIRPLLVEFLPLVLNFFAYHHLLISQSCNRPFDAYHRVLKPQLRTFLRCGDPFGG